MTEIDTAAPGEAVELRHRFTLNYGETAIDELTIS
jgi:hypothetical protein